jgi:hypothetical protein
MATTAIVLGLIIVAYAALLGQHRWSVAVRRSLGGTSHPGVVIGVCAAALLCVLVWWSPGLVFERWITGLTVLAMIIGAAVALTAAVTAGRAAADDPST